MKVVVATGNPHKVDEISAALAFEDWEFVPISEVGTFPEPEETGETFLANARIKAQAAHVATGLAVIADDSGLEVDSLGGRPGVFSKRYAGPEATDEENAALLLFELTGVPEDHRSARFCCTLVFLDESGAEIDVTGTCEGCIGHAPRGENGFGYDPVFLPDIYQGERTMAELTMDEKNEISHRGSALIALRNALAERFS